MGQLSLRGWLLIVSVLFAVLVVGGVALTTYIIVADGMRVVSALSHRIAPFEVGDQCAVKQRCHKQPGNLAL